MRARTAVLRSIPNALYPTFASAAAMTLDTHASPLPIGQSVLVEPASAVATSKGNMRKMAILGCVLLAAACSRGHSHATAPLTLQQQAESACRSAAPHDFFNAQPTTVGDIHAIFGPTRGTHAYSNVLPHVPAGAFA